MLRERSGFLNTLWRIADVILLVSCFTIAYHIRFTYFPIRPEVESIPTLAVYLPNILLLSLLWLLLAEALGLYKTKRIESPWTDWKIIAYILMLTVFLYTSVGFIFKSFDVSRLLLLLFTPFAFIVLGGWHFGFRLLLSNARVRGYNKRGLLIIGAGQTGRRFAYEISTHRETGYQVIGFLDDRIDDLPDHAAKVIGKVSDIRAVLENHLIDRVVVALGMNDSKHIQKVVKECDYAGVEVNIIPDLFQFIHPKAKVLNLNGIPLIGIRQNPVDTWQYVYLKRLFDILFSLTILLIISPLFLLIMATIKLTSEGPVFFVQKRLGTHARPFLFYKFRTMCISNDAESDTRWTVRDDQRVTWIGSILRSTSLDELPQFWNVLKGDMSVVGPRPERPHFAKMFREDIPAYMIRHQVKTGLTGWAQVNGLRGDTSIKERLEYDLYYIENWSFSLDLRIILMTIIKGFVNQNAY
ncbi:undecaprenyl-phosphate glucose phosphotransferase [candidate division KSB1 bacterium]|nr:undecaprenyl-phosphate glucose phosphotransferase [candidate division KSB1 bacterium]